MSKALMSRSADTRARIIEAAEQLFAERGIAATSMRAITAQAEVNLAAVNYHFGSKEGLIVEVYARRLRPVNDERLRLLGEAEGASAANLERVLHSYIAPVMRLIHDPERGGEIVMGLLGRALYEPDAHLSQIFHDEMAPVFGRFTAALRRCLPALSEEELFWRMHFGGGALAYTLAQIHRLEMVSQGLCDATDVDGVIRRLVEFIAAGMLTANGASGPGHRPKPQESSGPERRPTRSQRRLTA
jgi:AcrR family transcriptional regulator